MLIFRNLFNPNNRWFDFRDTTPSVVDKQEPIQGAIKVKLLFFGPLAEKLNQRTIDLSLSYGTTINQIIERFELSSMVSRGLVVALDGEIGVDLNSKVSDSSEIAFLPPVSGG